MARFEPSSISSIQNDPIEQEKRAKSEPSSRIHRSEKEIRILWRALSLRVSVCSRSDWAIKANSATSFESSSIDSRQNSLVVLQNRKLSGDLWAFERWLSDKITNSIMISELSSANWARNHELSGELLVFEHQFAPKLADNLTKSQI